MDVNTEDYGSYVRIDEVDSRESEEGSDDGTLDKQVEEETSYNVVKPYVGMKFSTDKEAYTFYNEYALKSGFGVRRGNVDKFKSDKAKIIGRTFVCNKSGFKPKEKTMEAGQEVVRHRTTRVGCTAKMRVSVTDHDTWKITNFEEEHTNHELTTPSKTAKHRSHRKLHREQSIKNLMTQLHGEGLRNTSIATVVNVLDPRGDDIVTPQQVHDHLRIERRNNVGQNCLQIAKHFQQISSTDIDFYFNFQWEDDGTLRSVFWADGRSRTSYLKFSDVIIFDVTYRTNNFNLPFAPFTGINHHRQSILFGCALLADETEDTFVWLFEEWMKCMWGKPPGAIITDQDAAIGNAIARVFPDTVYRYCDWHLEKNIKENMMHSVRTHGVEFQNYFESLRQSPSVSDAEAVWRIIESKYKMLANSWLPKLWNHRHSLIPCFLEGVFLAGARTTQRSESINAFFDGYVHASTSLHEFVIQYERALKHRRRAEEEEDFKTMNSEAVYGGRLSVCQRKMFKRCNKCIGLFIRSNFGILYLQQWCEDIIRFRHNNYQMV